MYQALYRKYRPFDFDSVVGQNSIIKTLKNSIITNRIGHAYMFFGPRGIGKTTVSKIFARAVNCLNPIDGNACGKCKNCLISSEKDCVDIFELDAASNNGVDDIREIINNVSLVPNSLKYKVYIIDEVHMLSTGAFNALLKTLEEPPSHVIFILATTDQQKVPETIISRCQCFSFKRISDNYIVKRLKEIVEKENILIDDDVLEQIAITSNGGLRDSLVLLDQLISFTTDKIDLNVFSELNGTISLKELDDFLNYITSFNYKDVINTINKFNDNGKNIVLVMNQLVNFIRDKIIFLISSNSVVDKNYINLLTLLIEDMFDIKTSSNPKISFEVLIIKFIYDNSNPTNNISVNSFNDFNISDASNVLSFNNDSINSNSFETTTNFSKSPIESVNTSYFDDSINTSNIVSSINDSNVSGEKEKFVKESKKITNIDSIISVRVNNALAEADKNLKKEIISKMDKISDFVFNNEIGYIASILMDSTVEFVSKDVVVLSIAYNSAIDQLYSVFEKLDSIFNKMLDTNFKVAIISTESAKKYKLDYMKNKNNNIKYVVEKEPEPIFEEIKNNDIISGSAIDLFGDIVEIN